MNSTPCLSEKDLILHHYGELAAAERGARHLAQCQECRTRLASLRADLERLPAPPVEIDDPVRARLAARVTERLQQPSWRWRPALGAAVVAAGVVLAFSQMSWPPKGGLQPRNQGDIQIASGPAEGPELEMLEELDLLENLEVLRQIEGV